MKFRIKTLSDRQMFKAKFSLSMGCLFAVFLLGKDYLINVQADEEMVDLWYNQEKFA